jgi:putative hydrolase of the HAD superfamily
VIEVIGLDGDDTLWHSESHFAEAHDTFAAVLAPYTDPEFDVVARHYETELRNLEVFGYGVKGFTLSMIETAIEVTDGRIRAAEIRRLLDLGKAMLTHPVELLDGVGDAVDALALAGYRLVLITKGDLFHQEQKLAASGLGERFDHVEIVSEKDERTYRRLMDRLGVAPARFCMVGNSLRSDVVPVLALGGRAVHVPYAITWVHEEAAHDGGVPTLASLAELPAWLAAQQTAVTRGSRTGGRRRRGR